MWQPERVAHFSMFPPYRIMCKWIKIQQIASKLMMFHVNWSIDELLSIDDRSYFSGSW